MSDFSTSSERGDPADSDIAAAEAILAVRVKPESGDLRDLLVGIAESDAADRPCQWLALVPGADDAELADACRTLVKAWHGRHRVKRPGDGGAERLARVRAAMAAAGLDGFIVPRGDEFQGEWVPARADRLAWISGFTGSAGSVIVLMDRAALFVDGRYTIQARAEVDGGLFEVVHLSDTTPQSWLASALDGHEGAVIGYDPWLHTPRGLKPMSGALSAIGAEFRPVEANLVDQCWPDQPPAPIGPIVPHGAELAGRSADEKLAEIAAAVSARRAGAGIIAQPDSIAWLLNVRGSDVPCSPLPLSFAIVHAEGRIDWFLDPRKLTADARAALPEAVGIRPVETLGAALDGLGGQGLAVLLDPARTAAWIDGRLRQAGARVVEGDDPCLLPKACKTGAELDGARTAHVRDAVAVCRFLAWLDAASAGGEAEPVTELTAAERLRGFRRQDPAWQGDSFETISGAGPNGAIVHYRVSAETNRPLTAGSLYLVDSGAQYRDGTTDVTRTVAIGEPDADMRGWFTRVLRGHIAVATCRFPQGATGAQLDPFARRPLWEAGGDYDHGTGHGVGSYLNVHEGPQSLSKGGGGTALKPGMIVSNEPGYYREGSFGIRIEALLVVREASGLTGAERPMLEFETLTLVPIDRRLIELPLLTRQERSWIDLYHARVHEAVAAHLTGADRQWLDQATAPLESDQAT